MIWGTCWVIFESKSPKQRRLAAWLGGAKCWWGEAEHLWCVARVEPLGQSVSPQFWSPPNSPNRVKHRKWRMWLIRYRQRFTPTRMYSRTYIHTNDMLINDIPCAQKHLCILRRFCTHWFLLHLFATFPWPRFWTPAISPRLVLLGGSKAYRTSTCSWHIRCHLSSLVAFFMLVWRSEERNGPLATRLG